MAAGAISSISAGVRQLNNLAHSQGQESVDTPRPHTLCCTEFLLSSA